MSEHRPENPVGVWVRNVWKRLTCRHDWDPVYHSYLDDNAHQRWCAVSKRQLTSKQEVEFSCGHTVSHEEECPRCEVERLRLKLAEARNASVPGSAWCGTQLDCEPAIGCTCRPAAMAETSNSMSIRELQARLPWAIPYSQEFRDSQDAEGHRHLIHDLLHVYKSLGRIAAMAEKIDHGKDPGMSVDQLAQETADLVICALHIANTNPLGAFSLQGAVLTSLDRRNGSRLSEKDGESQ